MSWLSSVWLVVWASVAVAQVDGGVGPPMRVQSRAAPDKVQVGEPFTLELLVTHEKDQRYELATPGNLGDFDFLGVKRERVDGADSSTTTFKVSLAAFALGSLRTPPLKLEVTQGAETRALEVQGAAVEVRSSLPKEQQEPQLHDVRPPMEVPIRSWLLVYVLLAMLAAGALGYLLVRRLRRPKALVTAAPARLEPLHVRTTKALDALAQENLPAQAKVKEFYFRLSEIVRGYLGERYAFDALECTTPELLEQLRARRTPGLPLKDLATFADASDMVRYAKGASEPVECQAMLELSYRVVKLTTPVATTAPTAPAKPNGTQ